MSEFNFTGRLSASKSLMNRSLILSSFKNDLQIKGQSLSEDVLYLKKALQEFANGRTEFHCGEAGTVLRFLALRVSRKKGEYTLFGSQRLFLRLKHELLKVLGQVGCHIEVQQNSLKIHSEGWRLTGDVMDIPSSQSSQFLSATALSSWGLDFDLPICAKNRISEGYWQMTRRFLTQSGLSLAEVGDEIYIPKHQYPTLSSYSIEQDMSNAFAVAAAASLKGSAHFIGLKCEESLQPDAYAFEILKQMGVSVEETKLGLFLTKAKTLKPIKVQLSSRPDLFPILCVLCSFAQGESILSGAVQLVNKESDRQKKMHELLGKLGVKAEMIDGGLTIQGGKVDSRKVIEFDTDRDHRLAMAAGLFKLMGLKINLSESSVVNKSFPDFWKVIGVEG